MIDVPKIVAGTAICALVLEPEHREELWYPTAPVDFWVQHDGEERPLQLVYSLRTGVVDEWVVWVTLLYWVPLVGMELAWLLVNCLRNGIVDDLA